VETGGWEERHGHVIGSDEQLDLGAPGDDALGTIGYQAGIPSSSHQSARWFAFAQRTRPAAATGISGALE